MDEILHSFTALGTAEGITACLTLIILEIVLGIDNLVFISILVGKVPKESQRKVRVIGLLLALVFRIILLLCIGWITKLTDTVVVLFEHDLSWRDIILLAGGMFLLAKSVTEIHHKVSHKDDDEEASNKKKLVRTVGAMIVQIIAIDLVFSLDSILTAVGLTNEVGIMIVAVVGAMIFMLLFAKAVGEFINKHPTIIVLALSFLIMIGFLLILEAFHTHVNKNYVYFAMGFAFVVEMLNMRMQGVAKKKAVAKKATEQSAPDEDS